MASKLPELVICHLEHMTGIETRTISLETDRSGPLTALTWPVDAPLVTVTDPATPRLIAR